MYRWQQVKALRARGVSIKKIARVLKLSKNTVRKYVRSNEPPVFKGGKHEVLLDSYEAKVREMLKRGYIGTRIFNELTGMGYKGSLSTVHRYVAGAKEEEEINGRVSTRVETPPGKQLQYDWKEWLLPVGGQAVKVYIHGLVLGYSRKKFYTYSLGITTQDVIRAIAAGIEFYNGVPEELVMDNAKQMVITHTQDGIVRYNDEFLRFCGLYGIEPSACQNYRARTKGKVERSIYYLQEHLLRGLELAELLEFDAKLKSFTSQYNARLHSSLGESPDDRFEVEMSHLRAIPQVEPGVLYDREIRKVSSDGYISWEGALYPVPMRLCLREVVCESVFGRLIRIYDSGGELAASHRVTLLQKGLRPPHPEHERLNRDYQDKRERLRNAVVERFSTLFGATGAYYISGLRQAVGPNIYWHLKEVLACCDMYDHGEIQRAVEECIHIGAYHKNSVLRLLNPLKMRAPSPSSNLSDMRLATADISRPLSAYADVAEVGHE